MKVYDNFIHKYYASILLSKNHEDVSSGSEYELEKRRVRRQKNVILDLLLNKPRRFEWQVSLLFFVLKKKKLSSHMAQISEYINLSNHKSIPMIKREKWLLI